MKTRILFAFALLITFFSTSQTNGWYQYHKPAQIFNLDVDASNNIHLATDSGYIKYNTTTNMVEDYANLTSQNPPIGRCYDVKVNPVNNNVALAFQGIQSMAIYDGTDYTIYNSGNSGYGDFTSASLHYTPSGMLYIFSKLDTKYQTFENGVFNSVQNISFRPEAIIENASGSKVYFAGRTIGGLADGLYEIDKATAVFTNYTTSNSGIHTNGVNCFFRDTNDLLYIGGGQGVSTLDAMGNWMTFQESLPINPSLFYSVFSFSKFTDGTFLVNNSEPNSSLDNGFSRVDFTTNTWTHFDSTTYCNNADQVQNMVIANDMVYTHFRTFGMSFQDGKLWSFDTSNNTCEEKNINHLNVGDFNSSFGIDGLAIRPDSDNPNNINILISSAQTLKTFSKSLTDESTSFLDATVLGTYTDLRDISVFNTSNGSEVAVVGADGWLHIDENNNATTIDHNISDFRAVGSTLFTFLNTNVEIFTGAVSGWRNGTMFESHKVTINTTDNTVVTEPINFTMPNDGLTRSSCIKDGNNIKCLDAAQSGNTRYLRSFSWDYMMNTQPEILFEDDISLHTEFVPDPWERLRVAIQGINDSIYTREVNLVTNEITYESHSIDVDDDGENDFFFKPTIGLNEGIGIAVLELFGRTLIFNPKNSGLTKQEILFGAILSLVDPTNFIIIEAIPESALEDLPSNLFISNASIYVYSDTHFAAVIGTNYGLLINTAIDYSSLTLSNDEVVLNDSDLIMYPNPANDIVSFSDKTINKIEVFDLNGRKVVEKASNTFSVESLITGIYIIKATNTNNQTISKKLIKK